MAKAQILLKIITLIILSPLGIISGMALGAVSAIRYLWDNDDIFAEAPEGQQ